MQQNVPVAEPLMQLIPTAIPDVLLLQPKVFSDERGYFLQSFQQQQYETLLARPLHFVQDNHSHSKQGVLRGLHYQIQNPQGKLVRVVRGAVFDVAVDIRQDSPTFGQWAGIELTEDNHKQFWVPPGFAHGFQVTSDSADFEYKCTEYYYPEDEACIRWDDQTLNIDWPLPQPVLSPKDATAPSFAELFK